MKRATSGPWQVILLFAVIGIVMVFAQRDKTPQAPSSTPAPVSSPVSAIHVSDLVPTYSDTSKIQITVPNKPYAIPSDGKRHEIRITILSPSGFTESHARYYAAGEKVQDVLSSPKHGRIRFYDNDALIGEVQL
ncbi:MAG: hypothetical protein QM758_09870 [Armatimonas sp.]